MKSDKEMPSLWQDPTSKIYYSNFRVPTDLVPHVGRTHILKSLRTREKSVAERRNCELWLEHQRKFDLLRRERSSVNASLCDEFIPHLLEEWLHHSLRDDEEQRLRGIIARSGEDNWHGYSMLIDELQEGALSGKHPEFLVREAAWFLNLKGVRFDPKSFAYLKFLDELSPLYARYLNALAARDEGRRVATPEAPVQPLVPLSVLVREFLENRPKAKATALKRDTACLAKFVEIVGDKPITALKQQDLRDFFQVVQRLPSQRGGPKRPKSISLREWAGTEITMSPETFKNNYVSPVRQLLKWAKSAYYDQGFPAGLTTDAINYQGTREKGEGKQRAFTTAELQRLFLGDEMRGFAADPNQAGRYWLPLLGLHTGARINELCQINPATDWIKKDGIECLNITTETEAGEDVTKSIKTGTPRIVPIHPKLIELGFLAYLERVKAGGTGRLFPEFRPKMGVASARAREWFSSLITATGLRDDTPFAKLTGFHAFRHTLITYAANHDDPTMEAEIDLITGHVGQGSSVKRGYISRRTIKRAYETVCKVDFAIPFVEPSK